MTKNLKPTPNVKEIWGPEKVERAMMDLTASLLSRFDFQKEDVILVGIQTRGALMARRIAEAVKKSVGVEVLVGDLDITLYRDDFSTIGVQPIIGETHLDFDIDGKKIVLIDDVLFTGRTIRAALDQIMDFGRPERIALAVLVDRGHRELPIAPDIAPLKIKTQRGESVNLHMIESDGKDEIVVCDPL